MGSNKIIVIGGGPAGMMAAITAAENLDNVTLIEKNLELGKKLKITGGGRCNLTNASEPQEIKENVITNRRFITKSLYKFTSQDLIRIIEAQGCPLNIEEDGCVFPKSNDSRDIMDALKKLLREKNVELELGWEVDKIITASNHVVGVALNNNKKIDADRVILATGGVSYPATGSNGKGHELAKELGHTITPLKASLVPLEIREKWMTELAGISFNNIKLRFDPPKKSKTINLEGDLLITHFGISGPAPLKLSAYLKDIDFPAKGLKIRIDFAPELSYEELKKYFVELAQSNKEVTTILTRFWPKNFVKKLSKELKIDCSKPLNQLRKEEREILINNVKNFSINIIKLKSIKEATVTSGGVQVEEVNPATMESKLIKGLYFAGEILDVDALTGGYNLQIAFSTGYLAGLLKSN